MPVYEIEMNGRTLEIEAPTPPTADVVRRAFGAVAQAPAIPPMQPMASHGQQPAADPRQAAWDSAVAEADAERRAFVEADSEASGRNQFDQGINDFRDGNALDGALNTAAGAGRMALTVAPGPVGRAVMAPIRAAANYAPKVAGPLVREGIARAGQAVGIPRTVTDTVTGVLGRLTGAGDDAAAARPGDRALVRSRVDEAAAQAQAAREGGAAAAMPSPSSPSIASRVDQAATRARVDRFAAEAQTQRAATASPVAASPAPVAPAAPMPAGMSPQRLQNELGLSARRAKVTLTEDQYQQAAQLVTSQGKSPMEAVLAVGRAQASPIASHAPAAAPAAASVPQTATSLGMNAAEAAEYARLIRLGKSAAQARKAIVTQRELASKLGTPSVDDAQQAVARRNATGRWDDQ